jgi:small subunit ribosomal protein S20
LTLTGTLSISRGLGKPRPCTVGCHHPHHKLTARLRRRRTAYEDETPMANTKSAKKMTRKIAKRTVVNRARRSRMRTFIRKVEEALATGDAATATAALKAAEPEVMRAAQKGIVHRNTASRKVSRLATRVNALAR